MFERKFYIGRKPNLLKCLKSCARRLKKNSPDFQKLDLVSIPTVP